MSVPPRFGREWLESKIQALQRELRELHEDRARSEDRLPAISFQVNCFTEWLKIHPAVVLHLGRLRKEFLLEPGWDAFIHPEDKGRCSALWLRCSRLGIPYAGLEYRWRHAETGRYVWLEEYLFPSSWSPGGRPVQMDGWFENITRRKRNEIEFLLGCLDDTRRGSAGETRRQVLEIARRETSRGANVVAQLSPLRVPKLRRFT